MKGDFSRLTFNPRKHFSSVRMQQGRVQLDADWNEQLDIIAHRFATQAADFIGASGAPRDSQGFELRLRTGLRFDGVDDFVDAGSASSLPIEQGGVFCIEIWMEPEKGGSGGSLIWVDGAFALRLDGDGHIRFSQEDDPNECPRPEENEPHAISSDEPIPFGSMTRVAVHCRDGRRKLYINGRLAAEDQYARAVVKGQGKLLFGAAMDGAARTSFYQGVIEEIRMWGGERSEHDIIAGTRSEIEGSEPGLIGCWSFDEGTGTIAHDKSRSGNDGVLGGGIEESRPAWVRDVVIGSGRYYVDGLMIENDEDFLFDEQSIYTDALIPLDTRESGSYLAYIDVWERFLTALEEPALREVALGGPDTTARTKMVWQIKMLPLDNPDDALDRRKQKRMLGALRRNRTMRAQRQIVTENLGNQLYRIEIHNGGGAYGWPRPSLPGVTPVAVTSANVRCSQLRVEEWFVDGEALMAGELLEIYSNETERDRKPGPLARIVAADERKMQITLDQIPEEMEGHTGIYVRRVATFKWSRENGAVAYRINTMDPESAVATVRPNGGDSLYVHEGDWVELSNDAAVMRGMTGPLYRIEAINRTYSQVTLNQVPISDVATTKDKRPLLRRWDQRVAAKGDMRDGTLIMQEGKWFDLEEGIQIEFTPGGSYRSGDYWTITSRALTGDIDWPKGDAGSQPLPPRGVEHHYDAIALVQFHGTKCRIRDLRTTFAPLTSDYLTTGGGTINGALTVEHGLHVSGNVRLHGDVEVGRLIGGMAPEMIGTSELKNGCVTNEKLALEVRGDLVPAGVSILSENAVPPPGYIATGLWLPVASNDPRWHKLGAIPTDTIGWLASAIVHGKIYCFLMSGEVWEFDPARDRWFQKADMPSPRRAFGVGVIEDKIYIVGGLEPFVEECGTTEEYDPATDTWTRRAGMPTPRSSLSVGVANGKLYAIGGHRKGWFGRYTTKRCEEYDPHTNTWRRRKDMPTYRIDFGVGTLQEEIYVVGGAKRSCFDRGVTARVDVYDPSSDRWRRKKSMPTSRRDIGVGVMNNKLYAIGGKGRVDWLPTNEEFDPEHDRWVKRTPLPVGRRHASVACQHGTMYVIGGLTAGGRTNVIEEITFVSSLHIHRKLHKAGSQ